jgi:hypothetical protein
MEDLEAANARIAELEGQVTSLSDERNAAVGLGEQLRTQLTETAGQRDAVTGQVAELTTARDAALASVSESQAATLAATRRALLAENAGQVVPELIDGDTVEALTASVEVAKAAQARATEAAKAALAGQTVPTGAGSARTVSPADGMSPLEMVTAGMAGKGAR